MGMDKNKDKAIAKLRELLSGKVDGFEIFLSHNSGVEIEARDGAVDSFKVRSSEGLGLRTVSGGRPGFAYSNILDDSALTSIVDSAVAGSREAECDECLGFVLPSKGVSEKELSLFDDSLREVKEEEKIEVALKIEEAAKKFDKRVKTVRGASFSESTRSTRVINSSGVDVVKSGTYISSSVMSVAEEVKGEPQTGFELAMSHNFSDIDAIKIGTEASRRAVSMLGAKTFGSKKGPVIFENTVVTEFMGALSSAFLADNVIKGKSMLKGRLGEKVLSEAISMYDDGLLSGGWASGLYDAEGSPKQRTPLITKGVLNAFLYDGYWARREGKAASTGNSVRGGYKGSPGVGIGNLYIEAGECTSDELISEMGSGLLITDVMGVHTVNPVSGEFSLGASGFVIKGGKIGEPIRGMAISGSLLTLFSKVEKAAGDMRFYGPIGAPSLLFSEVDVSGQ